jgi:hypothetical protein
MARNKASNDKYSDNLRRRSPFRLPIFGADAGDYSFARRRKTMDRRDTRAQEGLERHSGHLAEANQSVHNVG